MEAKASGPVQIANDNGGGQLVISGARAAVELAAKLGSEKGAKRAIMLPVSAPFHSTLMAPAADAMLEALAAVEKHDPVVPLIANVRAAPVTDANEIAALLVEQVTGQVRWRETIEWFSANGVTTLYEVGCGKVLTGLARRISKDVSALPLVRLRKSKQRLLLLTLDPEKSQTFRIRPCAEIEKQKGISHV